MSLVVDGAQRRSAANGDRLSVATTQGQAEFVLVSALIDQNACTDPEDHGPISSFILLP